MRLIAFALAMSCGAAVAPAFQDTPQRPPEPSEAAAPQPVPPGRAVEGAVVTEVRFEGLVQVAAGYAQSVIRTRAGDPFAEQTAQGDADRLFRTGKFDSVDVSEALDGDRLIVTFRVVERETAASIEFVGNRRFKSSRLLKEIELKEGAPLSDFALRQATDTIERLYREKGYTYVRVTHDAEALKRERRVIFSISEGPRVRVRHIVFEGASAFRPRELSGKIETKTYIWLFRTGDIDEERAQRDAAALAEFYRGEGYLDAQVGYELVLAPNQSDMTVRFVINEGVRYHVKSISFKGQTVFTPDQIRAEAGMKLTEGAPLRAEVLKQDVQRIQDLYWRSGYIYVAVRSDWVYSIEPALVDLTLTIDEDKQYRFGRIIIRGNEGTQDRVVRRILDFFPEDLYDQTATRSAEQRLRETRLFSEARISPIGDDPVYRDALVEVKEDRMTDLLFGVGVTTNNGVIGNITLENRNFDIFDWPRTSAEFFKGKSFRGAGQTLRLQLEPGTQVSRFRLDFREPFLFDQPYGGNIGLYYFERSFSEYDIERLGFTTSLDHRFRTGPLRNWSAEIALRFERVDIGGTDFFSDPDIKDVKGDSWLTSVKGTIVRNTTDSLFLPTRGSRLSLSWEQYGALGGDYDFSKTVGDYTRFYTLHTDTFDRKHVLALSGTVGNIFGDAPVFERFYGGGIGSIRGFEFRGVSPRGGFLIRDDERIGGDFMLLAGAEYSFPLAGKVLRGVTFLDMGTIEETATIEDWRAAVGIGARVYVPFFGPIPLSFDLAWPISKNSDDDTQVFSFSIGTSF